MARISAAERVRFEVVTTIPGVDRDVDVRGGGKGGASGAELVGVIRRVEEEPKSRRRGRRKAWVWTSGAST